MTAARKSSSLTSHRKHHRRAHDGSHPQGREVPAPADYCEDISEEYLDVLDKCLAAEFEGEIFEVVRGPAW